MERKNPYYNYIVGKMIDGRIPVNEIYTITTDEARHILANQRIPTNLQVSMINKMVKLKLMKRKNKCWIEIPAMEEE